jgi:hypothetical protein
MGYVSQNSRQTAVFPSNRSATATVDLTEHKESPSKRGPDLVQS